MLVERTPSSKAPMQQILIYSDSLSWGIVPNTRNRLPFDARWPGVLENGLNAGERRARVIEDCLNGRRTVFDDPFKPGRNGLQGLAQRIEVNSPLALVILALGTNDFQYNHPFNSSCRFLTWPSIRLSSAKAASFCLALRFAKSS